MQHFAVRRVFGKMPSVRSVISMFGLCSLVLLGSCSSAGPAALAPNVSPQWVVAWGASPQNAVSSSDNNGGSEQSFRFLLYPTVAGTRERVHFSNYFGSTPITIGAARLSVASSGDNGPAVDPSRDAGLTFGGSKSVTLQPHGEIDSDPVNITYAFGQWLAVSMYLQGTFPALTEHDAQVSTNFFSPAGSGDVTADTTGNSFSVADSKWLLMTSVEAYGPYQGTVAIFGSSSVDGHNSNVGDTLSYPAVSPVISGQSTDRPTDWLARSLISAGYSLGVLNAGLLGNPAAEDSLTQGGYSVAGVDRFKHDVLQQPGIAAVVIYIGGIDLRADCQPATAVEASLSNLVAQAAAAKVRVILATIPPSEYCVNVQPIPSGTSPYAGDLNPGPENPGSTQRRAVNTWIRTTGAQLPGVVSIADFDQVLAYPAHPDFMIPNLNSGDNFHPDGPGYGVQNSAIALQSILGQ